MPEPSLQAAPLPAPPVVGPDLPPPCGWWESSLELRSGLCITEHAGLEPLGDTVLPLWQLQ